MLPSCIADDRCAELSLFAAWKPVTIHCGIEPGFSDLRRIYWRSMESSAQSQISTQIGLWFGIAGALLLFVGYLGNTQQYRISRFLESFVWQDRPVNTIKNVLSFAAAGSSAIFLMVAFNVAMTFWVALVLAQVVEVWFAVAASLFVPIVIGLLIWRRVLALPLSATSAVIQSRLKKAFAIIWVGPWIVLFALPAVIVGYTLFAALAPIRKPFRRLKRRLGVAHMTPLLGIALIFIGFAFQLQGAIAK